jgi:hypothetical protein
MGSTFYIPLWGIPWDKYKALVLGCHSHMAPCLSYYIPCSACDTFVVYRQLQNERSAAWNQLGFGHIPLTLMVIRWALRFLVVPFTITRANSSYCSLLTLDLLPSLSSILVLILKLLSFGIIYHLSSSLTPLLSLNIQISSTYCQGKNE